MPGIVVSVLNMKGGVGKTTVSAHVMHLFYRHKGKKVLLVDLDPQFNLTQTLVSRRYYDSQKSQDNTIFTAMEPPPKTDLFDVKVTKTPPPKAWDISPRLQENGRAFIDLVCGDFDLVKYSLIADKGKLDKVKTRFLRFISQAKEDYDLVVIDCNPSSSFITQCALHACAHILVPVKAEVYSMLGLELLKKYIEDSPTLHPKPDLTILLNESPDWDTTRATEKEIRGHATLGPLVLAARLPYSTLLAARPNRFGFATNLGLPHRWTLYHRIRVIVDELSQKWGL